MAKKTQADLPIPEALLDKYVSFLEGPVNGVVERALKSRVVLAPLGLSQAIVWKSLGLLLGRPKSSPSSSSSQSQHTQQQKGN